MAYVMWSLVKVEERNTLWLFRIFLLVSKTLQEVEVSFYFVLIVYFVMLKCHLSHEMIWLRATRKLGKKARQTWPESISRPKLYSRKGLYLEWYLPLKIASSSVFDFPVIIVITFGNKTIVASKVNIVAWKNRCSLFPNRVLLSLYGLHSICKL